MTLRFVSYPRAPFGCELIRFASTASVAFACPRLPSLSLLFPNRPTPDPCLPLVLRIPPFTRRPRRARTDLFPFLLPQSIHPSIHLSPFPLSLLPYYTKPIYSTLATWVGGGGLWSSCFSGFSIYPSSLRPALTPLNHSPHPHRRCHPPSCWGTAAGSR